MSRQRNVDLALLAVAVVAISTSGPLVRQAAAPAFVIAFWRNAMAAGALVPIARVRHRNEVTALTSRDRRLIVLAGLLLAGHFATWIPSLSLTTVSSSVALLCVQPVWAALLARATGETVTRATWLGIAVALAGVIVLTGIDLSLDARAFGGDALALAGGALSAGYITVGAQVRRTVSTTVYTAGCYGAAAIALIVACAVARQDPVHLNAASWWCIVAITVGPQLLGHSVVNRVLRTMSATLVSVAILLEIVGATAIAWWWFDEAPPAGAYPAAALIALGVVIVVRAGNGAEVPVD